jgi:tetratricopeptide (TPR) repeat protein
MKKYVLLTTFLLLYVAVVYPFTSYLRNKPFLERMGHTPEPEVLRFLSADQTHFVAATLLVKVISYYGSLVEQVQKKVYIPPEYPEMQNTIETAVKLDPYNMDSYYFGQAIMVWDARQVKAMNGLLEYGMKFRNWDFYLPYFAGFNCAYFLKDYESAARYYRRAGELTGSDLLMKLTGRYLYEAGKTGLAVNYLSAMVKGTTNEAIKKTLQTRLRAFREVQSIEAAQQRYREINHRAVGSVEDLVHKGYLTAIPVDPYGGTFYLDKQGKVRSTSNFAYGVASQSRGR